MANEVLFSFAGKSGYFLVFNEKTGQVWNNLSGFETYTTANYSGYTTPAPQLGASLICEGNFPSGIVAGLYGIFAKSQLAGSGAETDPTVAGGTINWNGSNPLPLSDMATSGQVALVGPVRAARGVQIANFPIKLVSSADHNTPWTSGLISGQISRDGGPFGSLQSGALSGGVAFTEIGHGWYSLGALTSGDLLANTVALTFSAANASGTSDQRDFAFVMQRVSGSL
jgi:hypothetical protein